MISFPGLLPTLGGNESDMFHLVAPGDNGTIEPPSEDEDEGEVVLVETWELSEEDEGEEQGMVDSSSGGEGGERIAPDPTSISELEDDDEDMGDEGEL